MSKEEILKNIEDKSFLKARKIHIESMDDFSLWLRENNWYQCLYNNHSPISETCAEWYNEINNNRTYLLSEVYEIFLKNKEV